MIGNQRLGLIEYIEYIFSSKPSIIDYQSKIIVRTKLDGMIPNPTFLNVDVIKSNRMVLLTDVFISSKK